MAECTRFQLGDKVIIFGLRSKPQLNGQRATVVGQKVEPDGRWPVRLDNCGEVGMVKSDNLRAVTTTHAAESAFKSSESRTTIATSMTSTTRERTNLARLFSARLSRTGGSSCGTEASRLMSGHCIYIRGFYPKSAARQLFDALSDDLRMYEPTSLTLEKWAKRTGGAGKSGKKSGNDGRTMVFYGKHDITGRDQSKSDLYFSDTFERICRELCDYFDLRVRVVILNHYPNADSFIPFHHDSLTDHDMDLTVGLSLGHTRSLCFRHTRHEEAEFTLPQKSGDVFAFNARVNREFRHSLTKETKRRASIGPRFSIVIFGTRTSLTERNSGTEERMDPYLSRSVKPDSSRISSMTMTTKKSGMVESKDSSKRSTRNVWGQSSRDRRK